MTRQDFVINRQSRQDAARAIAFDNRLKAAVRQAREIQAEALVTGHRKDGTLAISDLPTDIKDQYFEILFN